MAEEKYLTIAIQDPWHIIRETCIPRLPEPVCRKLSLIKISESELRYSGSGEFAFFNGYTDLERDKFFYDSRVELIRNLRVELASDGYGYALGGYIKSDFFFTPKDKEMPLRLYSIQKDLKRLLNLFRPDCVIVEQLFFGANSRTAMTVGQARGVVLSTAASYRLPVFEYQGLHVKFTLTGSGRADKKQIQKSVMKYLGKRRLKKPLNGYLDDAADALAVAICHVIKIGKNSKGI